MISTTTHQHNDNLYNQVLNLATSTSQTLFNYTSNINDSTIDPPAMEEIISDLEAIHKDVLEDYKLKFDEITANPEIILRRIHDEFYDSTVRTVQ